MKYRTLFSPLTVRGLTLKNRVVVSAMGCLMIGRGRKVSQQLADYLGERAKGGVGVCLAALYEDPSPVNPQYIVNKEPKILGTCDNDLLGAMKGILAGTVSVEPLLDGIAGIEDFQEAFDRQMNGTAEKILIDMTR